MAAKCKRKVNKEAESDSSGVVVFVPFPSAELRIHRLRTTFMKSSTFRRSKPSWMLVAGADRTINPDLERLVCHTTSQQPQGRSPRRQPLGLRLQAEGGCSSDRRSRSARSVEEQRMADQASGTRRSGPPSGWLASSRVSFGSISFLCFLPHFAMSVRIGTRVLP
jgi:hypothetical protein